MLWGGCDTSLALAGTAAVGGGWFIGG